VGCIDLDVFACYVVEINGFIVLDICNGDKAVDFFVEVGK
jgi:hypothetical protein